MIKKLLAQYRGEIIYFLSVYFAPFSGLLSSIVATAFIDPVDLGALQKILLIPPYLSLLHLGVFNGLNRNIAFYKAQGKIDRVQTLVNSSWFVAKCVSFIGLAVAIGFATYTISTESSIVSRVAVVVLFFMLVISPFNLHINTTFRSGQEFGRLGVIKATEGGTLLILAFLPALLGWVGKVIYDCIKPLFAIYLRKRKQPIPAVPIYDKESIINLIQVGFPLLVGGYIYTIFNITDQSIIAYFLNTESLGIYNVSRMILISVPLIPIAISTMLYPKMSAQYAKTKSNKGLRILYWKSLFLNISLLVPLSLAIYFVIGPLVTWILPQYISGIPAAKVSSLTCITFIFLGPSVIMGVVRKNIVYISILTVAVLIYWFWAYSERSLNLLDVAYMRLKVSSAICIGVLLYTYYLTSIESFNE